MYGQYIINITISFIIFLLGFKTFPSWNTLKPEVFRQSSRFEHFSRAFRRKKTACFYRRSIIKVYYVYSILHTQTILFVGAQYKLGQLERFHYNI